jgi:hypothetical protein
MEEYIGNCEECGKKLYCLDGFFNGIAEEGKAIICFDCAGASPE